MNFDVFAMQNTSRHGKMPIEAGIRIYEICDSTESNPKPEDEIDMTLGEFITHQKLKEITGCSNLFDVMDLKLKVDTNETSIGNIGSMAPNLKKLNLNNSYITSVRDLGTSFNNLSMLWLCRCSIVELDGISSLNSLKELYLAFNEISDLSPLSLLDTLEFLDMEANNVDDIMQVEFLSLCTNLLNLTMKGNPIENSPRSDTKKVDLKFYSYPDAILSCLPALKILDDEPLLVERMDGKEVKRVNPKAAKRQLSPFENDLRLVEVSLKSLEVNENSENIEDPSTARPVSAQRRAKSASSPIKKKEIDKEALKKTPIDENKESPRKNDTTFGSNLTSGDVMCGNPFAALRQRKRLQLTTQQQPQETKEILPPTKSKSDTVVSHFKPEHSYFTKDDVLLNQKKDDVFEELRHWRLNNQALFCEENKDKISKTPKQQQQKRLPSKRSPIKSPCDPKSSSLPPVNFSPTPPSIARKKTTPTRTRRSLQSPPVSPHCHLDDVVDRPSTVAEMRSDRIQKATAASIGPLRNEPARRTIVEGEETFFDRVDVNANNKYSKEDTPPSLPSPTLPHRPTTARAALQSLQKPRLNDR